MKRLRLRLLLLLLCLPLVASAQAPGARPPYSQADVDFMTGMIVHHAQALVMAAWAPSHGANESVRILCERIIVAQTDEINATKRWLAERGLPFPDTASHQHDMPGMTHAMMPGMLTAGQLQQLQQARGPDFDRLFLTFMIQHHQGAITMVEALLDTPGAVQDGVIYRFATDVNADQLSEIDRMRRMLAAMTTQGR